MGVGGGLHELALQLKARGRHAHLQGVVGGGCRMWWGLVGVEGGFHELALQL